MFKKMQPHDNSILYKESLSLPGLNLLGHRKYQKAGHPLELHHHGECMELVFLIRGSQDYYIEDTVYSLIGGQAFVSLPHQLHKSGGICQDVGEFYWMNLDLSCTENFLGFNREMSLLTVDQLSHIRHHVIPFDADIKKLLPQMYTEFLCKGTTPFAVSSLMYLLYLFLNCSQKSQTLQNSFQELETYIECHLAETIGIDTLSELANVSPSTLQHRFKDYFGRSPAEYINYRKIQKSKELLLAGKSITDTAMMLGFNSSDYFSTVFRKFNGISPSQWVKGQIKTNGQDTH